MKRLLPPPLQKFSYVLEPRRFGRSVLILPPIERIMAAIAVDEGSPSHPPITILKRQRADAPLAQNKFLKKTARGKVLQCKLK